MRARNKSLRTDAGPAAAAVLSPGSFQPPAYKIIDPIQSAEMFDMKSAVVMTFYVKSADDKKDKKSTKGWNNNKKAAMGDQSPHSLWRGGTRRTGTASCPALSWGGSSSGSRLVAAALATTRG